MDIGRDRIACSFQSYERETGRNHARSEFEATCLFVLERVRRTGAPIIITRRGQPIAEVGPPSMATNRTGWLVTVRTAATIRGDLIDPTGPAAEWEALG